MNISRYLNIHVAYGLSTNSNGQIDALGAPYFSPSGIKKFWYFTLIDIFLLKNYTFLVYYLNNHQIHILLNQVSFHNSNLFYY
jgi:hypothetical protein